MKLRRILVVKAGGASLSPEYDRDELLYELTEILQDDFSEFEHDLERYHRKHLPPPDDAADDDPKVEKYDDAYIRFTDKLRKKLCIAFIKALQKL